MIDFELLTDKQFAAIFAELISKIKEDPVKNFIKARGFMNFNPTPAQTVALKIIFGKDLDPFTQHLVYAESIDVENKFCLHTTKMTEYQLFKFMTGKDYDVVKSGLTDEDYINMIDLIVGRRGGKTTLSAMLAIYCAISNDWTPFLQKTPFATVLILSHSREFSDEVLDLIRTLIETSTILNKLINKKKKNTASTMNLRIPWVQENGDINYSRVQIKVGAASSKTTRGVAACSVLCDEIAYWNLDENNKETDAKIMKAVRPATKQFGRHAIVIKLSSPGIKNGVLYSEYQKWQDGELPKNYVVFKAPSWVWNTILPTEEFVSEWVLDPDGFNTEYRANFVDSLSNFINPEYVDIAVMKNTKFMPPDVENRELKYHAAIDAAFKGDTFTFSVVGYTGNKVKQYISKGWQGSRQEPVKSKVVAQYIAKICKEYDIPYVTADQYAFQPLKEIFEEFGIVLQENVFNPKFKKVIYSNLKSLIHSNKIDLLDNQVQTKEIKELVVEQTNAGTIRIGHPPQGSDDFSDSLAIATYHAMQEAGNSFKNTFEAASVSSHGIQVDQNGRAFNAPSPEMLANDSTYGEYENVMDNSYLYMKHPETGKLVRKDEVDDTTDDGIHLI